MIRCPQCGQENPTGFRFCGACAAPLPAEEPIASEERKLVTVLFTDIAGSTAAAEKLDPEDVRARLAPYYALVRGVLERYGGTVEKFIGDAVVALFGAPVAHEDDAERAVRAALAVRAAVAALNKQDEWLDLHLRTAVHTGEALVVLGASAGEGEGMAAGDVMNTAARIQGAAPVDGIVVGEATYRATGHIFEYREARPVQAKGKAEAVPVWEVVGEQPAMQRRAVTTPLVGREEELRALVEAWQAATVERRPQLATIVGPPGIGKSRLLLALREVAEREGDVHLGRCLPYGEGMTYWPVREVIRDAAGVLHDDAPADVSQKLGLLLEGLRTGPSDELRTIAAALANLLEMESTPRGTYSAVEISQTELHWGLRRLLQLLALRRPLLLVFEDLHWADPTLLELLRSIVDADAEAPLLILGSARPELESEQSGFLQAGRRSRVVRLSALDRDGSLALVKQLLGAEAAASPAAAKLLEHAGGNPLFLEEMIRMIGDLEAVTDFEELPVPENLQALLGARLDALPAGEKQAAQQASVIGATFWEGAVAHLGGGTELPARLAALCRRDLVKQRLESTIACDREYAFKHILIRDVAYERLPKGKRAELHIRFADWLTEATGADDDYVEILAYHLTQACVLARSLARSGVDAPVEAAVDALRRSAIKAERREGMREAARFYERALGILDEDDVRSLEIRLGYGRMLTALGDLRGARAELTRVTDRAGEERPRLRCETLVALANLEQKRGLAADARRQLKEAEELAVQIGDRRLEVRAAYEAATLRADFDGAHEAAIEQVRGGLAIAERLGDRALRVEGHLRLGFFLFQIGDLAAAEDELVRCSALASEAGSFRDEARATFLLGLTRYYRGDVEEAERLALQTRDWLQRTGDAYFEIQNLTRALAVYALANGDPALAEERLRVAVPLALESGGWLVLETYRYLVEALVRQDRLSDARDLVEFAGRNVPEEDSYAQAELRIAQAFVATAQGDQEAATRAFCAAIELLKEQRLAIELGETRIAYARTLRGFGDELQAREQLVAARETFLPMDARSPLGEIDRELAQLAVETA